MAVTTLEDKVYLNDIGTGFRGTFKEDDTAVDISAAVTKTIKFEKPDGTTMLKVGSFVTDGTDGLLEYKSIDNDLDTSGNWRIQGYVDLVTWKGHSEIVNFKVYDYLT